MKPVAFAFDHPATLAAAGAILREQPGARLIAGGQSLGPMLAFRVARPARLVTLSQIGSLCGTQESREAVTFGACVTHAAIADGRAPDVAAGVLASIADAIAYRAIRNRGTIGGSLSHADPAADWLCTLTALGARVLTAAPDGGRAIPLADFVSGAFRTVLQPGEIVEAVRIPRPDPSFGWGYVKACRKPGEFAHAMAAAFIDPARGLRRLVIGAVGGPPVVLDGERAAPQCVDAALRACGLDAVGRHMQTVVAARALIEAEGRVRAAA